MKGKSRSDMKPLVLKLLKTSRKSGTICLPTAAASPDVDPLTGDLLSVHIYKS